MKQALADPLKFIYEKPLSPPKVPNEPTREKQETLNQLYEGLKPGYKRVVDARIAGREGAKL